MLKDVLVAAGTYGIVSAFVPLHYRWTASALLPLALVALTATGFSLIIGGLTLVFKRIQLLNDSVMIVVMLASAGALPLIAVPGWMAGAGRVFPPQGRDRQPVRRAARPPPGHRAVGHGRPGLAAGHRRRLPGRRDPGVPARRADRQDPRHPRAIEAQGQECSALAAAALLSRPARGRPVTGCPGRLCPGPWLPPAAYRASFSSPAR